MLRKQRKWGSKITYSWKTIIYSISAIRDIDQWYKKNENNLPIIFKEMAENKIPATFMKQLCIREILKIFKEKKATCTPDEKDELEKLINEYSNPTTAPTTSAAAKIEPVERITSSSAALFTQKPREPSPPAARNVFSFCTIL